MLAVGSCQHGGMDIGVGLPMKALEAEELSEFARTIEGVEFFATRSNNSFSPSGLPSRAALIAGPQWGSRFGRSPYHLLIASAAHCGVSFGFLWQLLQAFEVPSSTDKSGRGRRKL